MLQDQLNIGIKKPKIHQIRQAEKCKLNLLLNYNYLHTILYREFREKVEN